MFQKYILNVVKSVRNYSFRRSLRLYLVSKIFEEKYNKKENRQKKK